MESLIERNNKQPVSLWVGTLAEYSAITDKDENRLYLISDDGGLEGATNLVANTTDLNGVGLAFGANCPCTDSERIAALLRHKMAVVRVAGQTVLCSVQTAATSNTLSADDIVMITGCASSSYSNPVSISGSYTMHPLELVVVDIRIVFDTDRPAQATAANIYNYSRRQGLGSDTVEGVNVWRIDLLNATQY